MAQQVITHLLELRKRLIYSIIGFLLVFLCLFHFANPLYAYLSKPLLIYLPAGTRLIATDITSPFFVPLKLAAIAAFILVLPNTLYQLWQFIVPALYRHERRAILILTISSLAFFILGMMFCYFVVLPILCKFIAHFKSAEISMFTDISKYLDFLINLVLIFGCAFETPVIICVLIHYSIVSETQLKSLRKYIFVGCFIVAAILAPPDVLSQTLLAIPLYLLYELGLLYSQIVKLGSTSEHVTL